MNTKAFDEKYHKEKLVKYVLSSWISGYEMDCHSWYNNQGEAIRIIYLGNNEAIVIKSKDYGNIIIPEVEIRFKNLVGNE